MPMSEQTSTSNPPKTSLSHPSAEKLRIYGDFLYLSLRNPRYLRMSVSNLRSAIEPPIELGPYKIFRFDEVPRGLITWAWFNHDAEKRYVAGELLAPQDWRSGDHLWLIDIVAPYKGLTASISRWVMEPGNVTKREFWFRRVKGDKDTGRIVHVDFERPEGKSRMLDDSDFL